MDAAAARCLGLGLIEKAGQVHKAIGAEVFPKQTELAHPRQLGNLLKLPWGKHRLGTRSQFVDANLTPIKPWFSGQLAHLKDAPRNDARTVRQALHQIGVEDPAGEAGPDDIDPPEQRQPLLDGGLLRLLRRDRLIRDLFYGDPATLEAYDTRSGAEFALVLKLLWHRATPEQVHLVLSEAGIGKWPEATDHYRRHTLVKANRQIEHQREQSGASSG
jgi:hypothetical protein